MMLTGSPEALKKLQELFESGELVEIEDKSVEAVRYIDNHIPEARKVRLLQALRLKNKSTLVRERASARDRANALSLSLSLDRTLNRTLDYALISARALDRALDSALDRASDLNRALASDLKHNQQLNLERADLTNTNLRKINFRETNLTEANFTGADLTEADLTGAIVTRAILTDADVTRTIFSENEGLTDTDKIDLQRRGAILLDPPSSDVPSLVLR